MRRGDLGTVVAVGPLLSRTLEAVRDLDVTVLYATTVRPFDAEMFLGAAGADVILVEPYLAGTSAATVSRLLAHRPHRLLALGVEQLELRRYGSPADHQRAHGLDSAGVRARIERFLEEIEPAEQKHTHMNQAITASLRGTSGPYRPYLEHPTSQTAGRPAGADACGLLQLWPLQSTRASDG